MKSDNKNQRERERERERENSPERISVLLKSRPRFVDKKFPSLEQTFSYFLEEWRKKNVTHKIII
jgi:hypothetical protein